MEVILLTTPEHSLSCILLPSENATKHITSTCLAIIAVCSCKQCNAITLQQYGIMINMDCRHGMGKFLWDGNKIMKLRYGW